MISKTEKLLEAAKIIRKQSEAETELAKLVAASMLAGYELGALTAPKNKSST